MPTQPQTRAERHALRGHAAAPVGAEGWAAPEVRSRPLVVLGVVLAALVIAAATATGERLIEIVAVVLVGLVTAAGWPRLMRSATPGGSTVVLVVTALALGAALFARDVEPFLEHVPAALGVGVIGMCLHPLVQASARTQLARCLAGSALGALIIVAGGVLTSTVVHGGSPVVIVGIALAVAALVDLVTERPAAAVWMLPVGMLVGGLAGLGAHWILEGEPAAWPVLLGVLAAGSALALRRALSQQPQIDTVMGAIAAGAASVLLVGPIVHLVSRLPLA